jgi:molybdate transport system permease protein
MHAKFMRKYTLPPLFESTVLTPIEAQALLLSLRVAVVGVLGAMPFALLAAVPLARWRFLGKSFIEGLLLLPLVLPPVVVGYLLLITFGTHEPFGSWLMEHLGVRLAFSWHGAALASAVMTFPLQLRAIRLSLEGVDERLAEAAETLGAGALDKFLNVTLPLALPGVITGAITAFAAALGEFGAIITFVSNIPGETQTLPLAIYSALQQPGGELEATRLATLSALLALLGVGLAQFADRWARERLTS